MWLYNIHGSDVAYCPVDHAFAIVTSNFAFIYVDKWKVFVEVSLSNAYLISYECIPDQLIKRQFKLCIWCQKHDRNYVLVWFMIYLSWHWEGIIWSHKLKVIEICVLFQVQVHILENEIEIQEYTTVSSDAILLATDELDVVSPTRLL